MKTVLCYLMLLPAFVSCVERQTIPSDLPPETVQSIQSRVDKGTNPSIVVGIIDKNGPRYYLFGKTSFTGTPVNEHTIYEIGSISKVFTAILLAHEAEAGNVDIDDPAQKYLPSNVHMPKRGDEEITLGNLSDHTSGLPRMPSNFNPRDFSNPYADYTIDQMYAFISGYVLPRDIGAEYEYSNLAQGLLGHILALNNDMSYEALMVNVIAQPLGMHETKIVLDDKMKRNLAIGHSDYEEVSNWDIPTLAGAGGIRSSVHDLLIFLSANIGLSPSPLKSAMHKTHVVRHAKAGEARVGLGWHIRKGKDGDIVSHSGGTGGYRTFAGFVKETQKGVVVFTNATAGIDDIGISLLDPDASLPESRPTVASKFRKTLDSLGIGAAIACYHDAKENDDTYEFTEGVLATLGYEFINKDLTAALAIFELNTKEYPDSYRVHKSYADALVKQGDKNLAIEHYGKALALNPANKAAVIALEHLGEKWEPPIVDVPEVNLQAYTGTYAVLKGLDITITREGRTLFGQATGNPKLELLPKDAKVFYVKDLNATLTFDVDKKTVTLHQSGQDLVGKKIN